MPYFYLGHPLVFYILQNNCKLPLIQLIYYVIEIYYKNNCISFGMYLVDRTPSDVSFMYKNFRAYFVPFNVYIDMHFVTQKIAISI
jgi:hypothetical protein